MMRRWIAALMTLAMLLAACVGLLVGHLLKGTALPLPIVMSLIGVATLILFHASAAIRAGKP